MKILLLGDYSRLHSSLKEGLIALGHKVILVSDGDGFKNFPTDISIRPTFSEKFGIRTLKKIVYKVLKIDLSALERGIRFYKHNIHFHDFDIIQLINEKPIKTIPWLERSLMKKIFKHNKKVFLLSCGIDYISVQFMLNKGFAYSLMDPYLENHSVKEDYRYILNYTTKNHYKTHQLIFDNIQGVIATDFDYVLPLQKHPKFLGLIPNPINCDTIVINDINATEKIKLFLGINRGTYTKKGIVFFEKALDVLKKKYSEKVEVIIFENLPYNEYIKHYDNAHILLDQVYAYDQGYNALEAMAKGKVVFTGAEQEWLDHYQLKPNTVAINALPDVNYLVEKLSWLIENPDKLVEISKNARAFIEHEHYYVEVAKNYVSVWNG